MPTRLPGYMPQLDSLRTIAVLLVIVYHWFPTGQGVNVLPNGTIGVVIFFVLSGFLITRILLTNRYQISAGRETLGHTYRNFFVRRVLRIFPLYYLVITLVWWRFPWDSDIDTHPAYYYLYGYNILLSKTGNWADVLSPFWTLGVEEQLYLVWPWVVLLTPARQFRWVIVLMILGGIGFRAYRYTLGDLDGVLTPASFDTFGIGAIWAYITVIHSDKIPQFLRQLGLAAIVALVCFVALQFLNGDALPVVLFQRTTVAVMALFVITRASLGISGAVGWMLNSPVLQYLGRISYGLYVFHMLTPGHIVPFVIRTIDRFGLTIALGYWTHRLFSLAVLIAVASVSWYVFEKPINNLKRYFSYGGQKGGKERDGGKGREGLASASA